MKKAGQNIPEFLEEFDYFNYNYNGNYEYYNSNIPAFDENKEYEDEYNNDKIKEKEFFKLNDKYDK